MQQTDAETQFIQLIRFLMLQKRRLMTLGAQYELTPLQTMTLFLLDEPQPMHNLKTTFNCDASNVTGIADGLTQKGLAERVESPADRRIKMLVLTDKGLQTRHELIDSLNTEAPLLQGLTNDEATTFMQLLQKLSA